MNLVNNQAEIFIIFTLNGILIGLVFDIFRILRKSFKTKDFLTYIEDACFWIITGIIIIYSMYKFCDGELRLFMVLGIGIGFLIYIFTVSIYIIKISVILIQIIKTILGFPIKLIHKLTQKIIKRTVIFIHNIIKGNIVKLIKIILKNIKKSKIRSKNRGIFKKK